MSSVGNSSVEEQVEHWQQRRSNDIDDSNVSEVSGNVTAVALQGRAQSIQQYFTISGKLPTNLCDSIDN